MRWKSRIEGKAMAFDEDMFALGKTRDWEACHRRIDEEEPGHDQQTRFSIAFWRSAVFKSQGRYEDALRILDARTVGLSGPRVRA